MEELVVDLLVDEDTRARAADLAVVVAVCGESATIAEQGRGDILDTEGGPLDSLIEIAVIEDDVRGLAAELESDVLEVGLGSRLHDLAANQGRAGEGDLRADPDQPPPPVWLTRQVRTFSMSMCSAIAWPTMLP